MDFPRVCSWCRRELEATARRDSVFCGKSCRQAAFRLRRRRTTEEAGRGSLCFAYADPPYPGLARRYYGGESTYEGEIDHVALIADLEASGLAGWALSTSAKALRDVLPLCPPQARVCAWTKPHGAHPATHGLHNVWEPLIVVRGRQQAPGKRDCLSALPARGGGSLPGRKPLAFCAWLFECLGMLPGDRLLDLFPGSGIVGAAWAELSRSSRSDGPEPSQRSSRDASGPVLPARGGTTRLRELASPLQGGDMSWAAANDVSGEVLDDVSSPAGRDTPRAALGDASPGAAVDEGVR